jgi:hypothetical protein
LGISVKHRALRVIVAIQKALGWSLIGIAVLSLITVVARGEESLAFAAALGAGRFASISCGYVIDLLIDIQASAYATAVNIATLIERQTNLSNTGATRLQS